MCVHLLGNEGLAFFVKLRSSLEEGRTAGRLSLGFLFLPFPSCRPTLSARKEDGDSFDNAISLVNLSPDLADTGGGRDWNAADAINLVRSLDNVGSIPLGIQSPRASLAESTVAYVIPIPGWPSPGCSHIFRKCCCGRFRDTEWTVFVDSRPLQPSSTCNHRRVSFPYKNPILGGFHPVLYSSFSYTPFYLTWLKTNVLSTVSPYQAFLYLIYCHSQHRIEPHATRQTWTRAPRCVVYDPTAFDPLVPKPRLRFVCGTDPTRQTSRQVETHTSRTRSKAPRSMTAAVSHWTRSPGTSVRPRSHPTDLDGEMTYLGVQFAVEPMDADKDGNGGSAHLPWEGVTAAEAAVPAGVAAGRGSAASVSVDEGLLFEEFVDLERLSTAGDDELAPAPLPDSFFFNMSLPTHGSESTTSVSGDLDELLGCHQSQPPPPMETKTSASSAGPTSTAVSSAGTRAPPQNVGFPEVESSWPIQRPEGVGRGQQRKVTYPDTGCAVGPKSISDSELLRLEGISLKASPSRAHSVTVSHPPTPFLQSSSATSSNTNLHLTGSGHTNLALAGNSNSYDTTTTNNNHAHNGIRKPSNFFKAVASKLQQKAASVRHKQPNNNMSSVAVDSSGPMSPNLNAPPRKDFKLRPDYVDVHGYGTSTTAKLPLSPPNSATLPPDLPPTSSAGGNGMPFVNGYLDDPFTTMFRPSDPTTPMDTPVLDDNRGMFYSHQQMSSSNVANTSKATWPMTTTTPQTDNHAAWANTYGTTDGLDHQWWDGSSMDLSANSQYQAQNARNASYNLAMHTQQHDLAYEYNPLAGAGSEMSGLMIHMPQPRATSSPVVHYQQSQPLHHQPHAAPQQMTERRPRMPRAPSAGARHMCLTTPMRKTRNPGSRQASRESSTSPTPTNRHSSSGSLGSIGGGGALSASVKKRRSWTNRRDSLRTPSIGSGFGGGGGSQEGLGFVNFTPSDKNILMTGVAPSGSSKTKARREKEALEKRRRLSEAAIKAVKEAGGDVEKFREREEQFFGN